MSCDHLGKTAGLKLDQVKIAIYEHSVRNRIQDLGMQSWKILVTFLLVSYDNVVRLCRNFNLGHHTDHNLSQCI